MKNIIVLLLSTLFNFRCKAQTIIQLKKVIEYMDVKELSQRILSKRC
jgi:hypothetical protein